jgi:hypothetical protein
MSPGEVIPLRTTIAWVGWGPAGACRGVRPSRTLWPSRVVVVGEGVELLLQLDVSGVLGQLAAGASIDELLADPVSGMRGSSPALEYAAPAAQGRELRAASKLSDLGARTHRIAESTEGKLNDDEASIRAPAWPLSLAAGAICGAIGRVPYVVPYTVSSCARPASTSMTSRRTASPA